MAIQHEELIARAQELRERLERMQRWFEENADDADAEGLRWRKSVSTRPSGNMRSCCR